MTEDILQKQNQIQNLNPTLGRHVSSSSYARRIHILLRICDACILLLIHHTLGQALKARGEVGAGESVTISYGEKCNAHFLVQYGFVPP
jgi:hypothetical protein